MSCTFHYLAHSEIANANDLEEKLVTESLSTRSKMAQLSNIKGRRSAGLALQDAMAIRRTILH